MAEQQAIDAALAALTAALKPVEEKVEAVVKPEAVATTAADPDAIYTYTVQFASPDARAIDAALSAVRGVAGVQAASTSSIAIGGTSVMRVTMKGDIAVLAAALRSRGWQVSGGGTTLSIRR